MESDRNWQILIEKMVEQSQAKLEQTQVTAMTSMDDPNPAFVYTERSQNEEPGVRSLTLIRIDPPILMANNPSTLVLSE